MGGQLGIWQTMALNETKVHKGSSLLLSGQDIVLSQYYYGLSNNLRSISLIDEESNHDYNK